ncbi:hypothetical protein [Streptomyces sp. NRRL S-1022]|uniref:hypothetical protein n=1 Tax=Streptomyces sp. NRRL S-1022 TaxID=1463880 RepID=UPI0004BF4EFB|nr:hypothetical protein [Streptomyces sp. NRRL S-1022]
MGVHLRDHAGPVGQSLSGAVGCLPPAATGAAGCPRPGLEFHRYGATGVVPAAADDRRPSPRPPTAGPGS